MNQPSHNTFEIRHSGSTWDNYLLQEKWTSASTLLWMFCDSCYQVFWQFCIIHYLKRRFPLLRCFGVIYHFSLEGLWDWKIFSKLHCLFTKKGTYAALGNRSMNCPSYERLIALWTEERYRTCINCPLYHYMKYSMFNQYLCDWTKLCFFLALSLPLNSKLVSLKQPYPVWYTGCTGR